MQGLSRKGTFVATNVLRKLVSETWNAKENEALQFGYRTKYAGRGVSMRWDCHCVVWPDITCVQNRQIPSNRQWCPICTLQTANVTGKERISNPVIKSQAEGESWWFLRILHYWPTFSVVSLYHCCACITLELLTCSCACHARAFSCAFWIDGNGCYGNWGRQGSVSCHWWRWWSRLHEWVVRRPGQIDGPAPRPRKRDSWHLSVSGRKLSEVP